MPIPKADLAIEASAVEGYVHVESASGASLFMTPQAVLASLEPLRQAAEAASLESQDGTADALG